MKRLSKPVTVTLTVNLRPLPLLLVGAALLVAGLVPTLHPAWADGDAATDAVPRILPYQGMLELDGRPLDATGDRALHLELALYDGPDAPEPAYRQAMSVEVFQGRFTAPIGPTGLGPDGAPRPLQDVIAAADDLYLGMTLLGDPDDPDDDIALQNRQRIHATPYAMWAHTATDLTVARDAIVHRHLGVGGDLRIEGDVSLPADAIAGDEIADGTVRLRDLDGRIPGDGLAAAGDALTVDGDWLDDRIRSWVRGHCQIRLGWRDGCQGCQNPPAHSVTVGADGICTQGDGGFTRCRDDNQWGGVSTSGTVDGNDVFYIRLICD